MSQRITLAKVYRAFPELDPFSDEECEQYIQHVRAVHPWRIVRMPWIIAGIGAVFWLASASALVTEEYSRNGVRTSAQIAAAGVVWAAGFGFLCYVGARDAGLRRALRSQISDLKCPSCRYSLLGLPVVGDVAVCPECGMGITLAEYHLTPEDLLARPAGATSPNHQESPA